MLLWVEQCLGHICLHRIDELEDVSLLEISLILVDHLIELSSDCQQVRFSLVFKK